MSSGTEINAVLARLATARKNAGLSQGQVAVLLGLSGTATTISQWEHGGGGLALPRLLELCKLYGVSVTWVMTGANPNFDAGDLMTAARAAEVIARLKDVLESLGVQP